MTSMGETSRLAGQPSERRVEAPMKIYFCDLCNESVPVSDLREGRANAVRGKIVCSQCIPPAKEAEAGAPAAAKSSLTPWVALGLGGLALLVAGGAVAIGWMTKQTVDGWQDPTPELAALSTRLDSLEGDRTPLDARLSAAERSRREFSSDLEAVGHDLAEQGRKLDSLDQAIADVRGVLDVLRHEGENRQKLELQVQGLADAVQEFRGSLGEIDRRVAALADMGVGGARPADGSPPAAEDFSGFEPEVRAQLERLQSPDATTRWGAVDWLGGLDDPELIPFFLPLLDDPDVFVQYRVIDALRNLKARSAVGRLIGLLRDGDPIVREEALEALVVLTGFTHRFETDNLDASEREKGVREWEKWYEDNRARFEGR